MPPLLLSKSRNSAILLNVLLAAPAKEKLRVCHWFTCVTSANTSIAGAELSLVSSLNKALPVTGEYTLYWKAVLVEKSILVASKVSMPAQLPSVPLTYLATFALVFAPVADGLATTSYVLPPNPVNGGFAPSKSRGKDEKAGGGGGGGTKSLGIRR